MSHFKFEDNYYFITCNSIDTTKAMENAIKSTQAAVKHWVESKERPYCVEIQYLDENEDEIDFWETVASIKEVHPTAEKYIQYCIQCLEKDNYIVEDDETPLAGIAIYQLCMADKSFIKYYCQMIPLWDLGHECNEYEYIENIIEKYGWCEETADLIVARAGSDGLYGLQQLRELSDLIIENNAPLEESAYFKKLVKAVYDYAWNNQYRSVCEKDAKEIFGYKMGPAALKIALEMGLK